MGENYSTVGDIYSMLNKVCSILRSDIKTLIDKNEILDEEYTTRYKFETNTDTKSEAMSNLDCTFKLIKELSEILNTICTTYLYPNSILKEDECISSIVSMLGPYGMIDISYSAKGKITIDLKHCNEIEEL